MELTVNYNREIITGENKILTIYLMLIHHQHVDYETIHQRYGITVRTFYRIIATIRDSLEMTGIQGQLIFNRQQGSYILLIIRRK